MKKYFFVFLCFFLISCSKQNDSVINYVEAKEKIINEGAILVDVRTEEEYNDNHISGAVLLTLDTINEDTIKEIVDDKNKAIIVYCKSGIRSHQAMETIKSLGYNNVYDLGAMTNWKE